MTRNGMQSNVLACFYDACRMRLLLLARYTGILLLLFLSGGASKRWNVMAYINPRKLTVRPVMPSA